MIDTVNTSRDVDRFRPNITLKKSIISPVACKILVVALTVLAFSAATYFSFLAALPLLANHTFTISSFFALGATFGCALATLTALIASPLWGMNRNTVTNQKDAIKFLGAMLAVACLAGVVFLYKWLKQGR